MPDWQLFRTETRGRKKLPIGKKQHLKIVHFTPESVVHYTPDCVVQYSPVDIPVMLTPSPVILTPIKDDGLREL